TILSLPLLSSFLIPLHPVLYSFSFFFFFIDPAPTEIYTLSLHDALPICGGEISSAFIRLSPREREVLQLMAEGRATKEIAHDLRSEEHTSELQSRGHLVCRLLLEKKKKTKRAIFDIRAIACSMHTIM